MHHDLAQTYNHLWRPAVHCRLISSAAAADRSVCHFHCVQHSRTSLAPAKVFQVLVKAIVSRYVGVGFLV